MIFTLTDRNYNALDAYQTQDYLIGQYIGSILETLEIEVAVNSLNAEHWVEGNYIMCTDKSGRNYWFTIYDADDTLKDDYKKLSCFSGTIDIVSEEFPPIKTTTAQPFKWYFDKIFFDTGIVLGINEISDLKRTLEFESRNATNVEMLQYVLNAFDNADARLEVDFDGVKPEKIILNVYRYLGSKDTQEILSSEIENLEELERSGSISELGTALRCEGEENEGKVINLKGKYYEEKNKDGKILYYSPKDRSEVFSVVGKEKFFADLPNKGKGEFDGYILRDYQSQAKTQDALWREALIKLKKIDHAIVEYAARGNITCSLGDNIQIVALDMKPRVMISARVTEYKFNDDDYSRNEYKFSNFIDLESNMSELDKIIADIKKDIDYVVSTEITYSVGNDNVTVPVNWVTEIPIVPEGKYLWTRTSTTMSKGTINHAYSISYVSIDGKDGVDGKNGTDGKDGQQGIQGVPGKDGSNGKDGATGPQGPPTGITTSASVPTNPYVNMLWQNTGNTPGYITGVTYQWNGAKWNIYIFTAENIAVTSLSAISSNIGMITAGVINGAVIISEFQRDLWEGSGIYKKGRIQITNGQTITTFDEIQRSTNTILAKGLIISDENGFSISRVTPAGQLLNGTTYATDYIGMSDVANGFAGKITAANLTETPWITLPLRTGYSIAEDNPPQYRIIYNLDGTKEIVFRGQYKRDSGAMLAGSDQHPFDLPSEIYPATTIMGYGATNTGNGGRLYCTSSGWFGTIIGSSNATYVEISSMSYTIKNYTRSVVNA